MKVIQNGGDLPSHQLNHFSPTPYMKPHQFKIVAQGATPLQNGSSSQGGGIVRLPGPPATTAFRLLMSHQV